LCIAQKVLDILDGHPKMGTIAAMHNTSRPGQTISLRLATNPMRSAQTDRNPGA
jgi:hypothetical protein